MESERTDSDDDRGRVGLEVARTVSDTGVRQSLGASVSDGDVHGVERQFDQHLQDVGQGLKKAAQPSVVYSAEGDSKEEAHKEGQEGVRRGDNVLEESGGGTHCKRKAVVSLVDPRYLSSKKRLTRADDVGVGEDDSLGRSGRSRRVHDAESVISAGHLGEVRRRLLSVLAQVVDVDELSVSRLDNGSDRREKVLRQRKECQFDTDRCPWPESTHLVLALAVVDDVSDVLSSSLVVLVVALLAIVNVLLALLEDGSEGREKSSVGEDGLDLGLGQRVGESCRGRPYEVSTSASTSATLTASAPEVPRVG